MAKLILVEGSPGAGKSTTAQWLALTLQRQGRPCRWFYEQQQPHPVVGLEAGADFPTWDGYYDDRVRRWERFGNDAGASKGLTIFESAFLQYLIFVTLRWLAEPETIIPFLVRIAEAIRPLDPFLVYLDTPDPDAVYQEIVVRRGPQWVAGATRYFEQSDYAAKRGLRGLDGVLTFWREHYALTRQAVDALPLRKLIVDPRRGDWPSRRAEIARFVNLSPAATTVDSDVDLAGYVGRYRVEWKGTTHECAIALQGGALVVNDLGTVLWLANRLIRKDRDVFYAEAWPYEVVLGRAVDGDGLRSMVIRMPLS